MEKYCILCGEVMDADGLCSNKHIFHKMCLNCKYLGTNDNGEQVCTNENNLTAAVEKVKSSVPGGYSIVNLELTPIPLKRPTAHCNEWVISEETLEHIKTLFV